MMGREVETAQFADRLRGFIGAVLVDRPQGQDEVNVPMIRHWVEAMGLEPGIHLDHAAAIATGRGGIVAPAAMTQTWVMRGYAATVAPPDADPGPYDELLAVLDSEGFTSVVATDSDFEFHRELVPGDLVGYDEVVEDISAQKETGLGVGHFITTLKTYRDQDGETVATQRWRTLRFRPRAARQDESRASRPRPAINRDNQFWFEAAREHRLVIQRCAECSTLRHPPGPGCFTCGSFSWDTVDAAPRARLYSWVVAHHPQHPAFDYPLVIGLVELDEGIRLTANLVEVDPEELMIGMSLELVWIEPDPDLTLPAFRPVGKSEEEARP